jgi:hypothetical protein
VSSSVSASVRDRIAWPLAVLVLSLGVADLAMQQQTARIMLAAVCALVAVVLAFLAPRDLLVTLIVWFAVLGLIRRLVTEAGISSGADPLLLIGPIAIGAIVVASFAGNEAVKRSTLATSVAVLSALVVLGAANPLQGGPSVGLSGLLFMLVPLLAFWIGRNLCDDALFARVLKIVGVLAAAAAVYGLIQTFVGFPSWDRLWIASQGYAALNVGGTTRAFAAFSSAAEYANYLAIGIVVWLAFYWRKAWFATLVAVPALAIALFFESSRGVLVMLLFALGMMLAARRRLSLLTSGLVAAACAIALSVGLATVGGSSAPATSTTAQLAQHQLQGLANPLDPQSSTLLVHLNLVWHGLSSAFTEPVGRGTGVVTRAAKKFGGNGEQTESDPSNMAVALGLPGLLAYIFVAVLAWRTVYRVAVRSQDAVSYAALGIVAVVTFAWLIGGEYAVAPLPWLAIGWADRRLTEMAVDETNA